MHANCALLPARRVRRGRPPRPAPPAAVQAAIRLCCHSLACPDPRLQAKAPCAPARAAVDSGASGGGGFPSDSSGDSLPAAGPAPAAARRTSHVHASGDAGATPSGDAGGDAAAGTAGGGGGGASNAAVRAPDGLRSGVCAWRRAWGALPVFRADVACALGVAARHPFDSEHAFSRTPHGCRCLCKEKGCGCSGRGEAGSCARGMAIGCHDEPGAWRSSAMAAWSDPSMPPHAQSPDNGGGDGSDSTPAPRRRPRAGSPLLPSDGTGLPLGTSASGNSTPAAADGGDAGAGGAAWADAPVPSRGRRSGPGRWRPGLLRAHADEVLARGAGRVALPWWKPALNMQTLPPPCRASFAVNLGPVHKTGWILR